MGHHHKKRGNNPAQRPRPPPASPSSPDGTPTATPSSPMADGDPATIVFLVEDDRPNSAAPPPPPPGPGECRHSPKGAADSAVKQECERALVALRRGNHTKAIRLMKEAVARHGSSALLHRVHGTVSVKVASLMDDPNAKLRHLRNAVDSARRAAELSPCSVEFAHFYANLLYEAATDSKGYDEVMQECERALSIPEPVDPARESLHQDESQQRLGPTPEARVAHIQQELRSLIQKANIASISSWMKNLNGSAVGMGEDKVRLIPIRRLSSPEDPMEVRLIQSARRPNEIKKATKTPEERRKEIEVRVAAARLLQQKPSPSSCNEDEPSPPSSSPSPSSSSGSQRLVERRKLMNARKLMSSGERMDQVKRYWNSMGSDRRRSFFEVIVLDLKQHYVASKDSLASDVLSEALSFAEASSMWKFWLCCRCGGGEKFANSDSHEQHVMHEHMGSLSPKLQSVLPQELDVEWVEMLNNGNWKPIDTSASVKMIEEEQLLKYRSLPRDIDSDDTGKDRDSLSDYWSSRDTSDSSSSPQGDSNVDDICSGLPEERKDNYTANFNFGESNGNFYKWPLSDDMERSKLLERIHGMFQLLLRHRCLATAHLNKVVQFTINELQGLPFGPYLPSQPLDQSPLCICFLEASQLRKVFKFLQDLSQSCGLGRYPEKSSLADDVQNIMQGSEFQEELVLTCGSSKLLLDTHLFRIKCISSGVDNTHTDDGTHTWDTNAFISWLFAGPSTGEQLGVWTHLMEEKLQQGKEMLQLLEKEFYVLQNACETKCEHLSYEEALQTIENLRLEEIKRREHAAKFDFQSYEAVLRRREELLKRENDAMPLGSRFELDAISNVLKEAQSLNVSQFGYDETSSGMASRLCEVDAGDDDDWKMQDNLYQADTCVEIAIQRQKEQLSLELSKIDARIMRNMAGMQLLENKLGPASCFDYRIVIVPLVKSFMRSCLEDLVDKDATEKSNAAREAFLAELALDAKKSTNKAGDHSKQMQEKLKDKRKGRDYRKSKDIKASNSSEQALYSSEAEEKIADFLVETDASHIRPEHITSDYLNEQEEDRRRVELEAEERKLGEALEYQRRVEHEAKQRHLAEQCRRAGATSPGYTESIDSSINTEHASLEDESGHHSETKPLDDGLIHLKGIEFGDFHWSEFTSSKVHQKFGLDVSKAKPGDAESMDANSLEKSSVGVSGSKIKKSSGHFHSKQKGPLGVSHNGVAPSDLTGRQESRHNSFVTSPEGSSRPRSEKENPAISHSPNDVHFKDQTHDADSGTKTLRQLHAEEDDEERFQADLKKAVRQSLDTFQAQKCLPMAPISNLSKGVSLDIVNVGDATIENNTTGKDMFGSGLKNEIGEYNCFLNVIIQSLWHLSQFRDEFLRSSTMHTHAGDPCVVCALYDIFTALSLASAESHGDAVAPTCLRTALSNFYPDRNFFQEAQMNDASEVLEVIFDCLHQSFTSSVRGHTTESEESNGMGSWDCTSNSCMVHKLFGMDIFEQMNCSNCGVESRRLKYTSFSHNINASALRTMKIACADSSLDELLKLVEMNHQLPCDMGAGGCGKPNYKHHILSTAPYFFTIVLGWQNARESADDISSTLTALSTDLDIGVMYRGLDTGNKRSLVSVVCYYGQHYVCFAYNHQHEEWVMYDDNTVKVIGGWDDVLSMCQKGYLQPQVLFFEAVD
uniref:Inactive ubiquitin carboxyl-terminal hydrolase 54 n=1 Tax=Anthurium amnicola TaxID=1678845 RepID=A0A1D1YV94_9ARAE